MPDSLAEAVGILGGSFNPVHNGHLRMAIEVRETLGLKRVDLLPARIPPHKSSSGLLPFSLRLDLVREAVQGIDGLEVSDLEGQMPVPSYSYLTLVRLAESNPDIHYVFILGGTDLLTLPEWHRGLEIPLITDIAVAGRLGVGAEMIDGFLDAHWTWIKEESCARQVVGGKRVFFVSLPRLDISASLVRDRFQQGRDVAGLVPEAVRRRMLAEPRIFNDYWSLLP